MELIPNDPIVQCMMDTGYPPWMQESMDEVEFEDQVGLPEFVQNVYMQLRFGKENARTRSQLMARTGLSDRQVRKAIEILRREVIILNDQDGRGYYLSSDTAEIRKAFRQEMSRAKSIMYRLKPMRSHLRYRGLL